MLICHALRMLFNNLVLQVQLIPCEMQCLMQPTITCRQIEKKKTNIVHKQSPAPHKVTCIIHRESTPKTGASIDFFCVPFLLLFSYSFHSSQLTHYALQQVHCVLSAIGCIFHLMLLPTDMPCL